MLRILKGRGGQGKTTQVLCRMQQEGAIRKQLLLVPEQASFEMERRFCLENGNQAGQYGEVLSFSRLENRVLSLVGGLAEPVLDAGGRLLLMYAALKAVSSHLTVYAMPSQKPEFLGSLLATVDELKSYCVTAENLLQVGEDTEGLDGKKLKDLGLILGTYEAMTARSGLDPRERLTRLAEKLRSYPFFQGKDVYLDGFTDFTPQQGLVLEEILKQANTVTVTLTYGEEDGEVFAPAHQTTAWLTRLAKKAKSTVEEETLSISGMERPPMLEHLEKNLFAEDPVPYEAKEDGSVRYGKLKNPREELLFAAGEIRRLVQEEGFRYRDIALTARTMERYWEPMEGIFAQYEIPVFLSDMTDVLQKPIFTLILSAMDAVKGGYRYEDMFRYLKTGLCGLSAEECDRLENYVLTWDIWGGRWTARKGFTMHPNGYHQTMTDKDRETLKMLNDLRLRVIEPLENFRKKDKKTVKEQVISLYSFLEEIHLPESLEERTELLFSRGEPELAEEYRQLWEIFCEGLVQCVSILGEQEVAFSEFSRLLRLLLSQYSVGSIPASLDRVTAGDAQRLMGKRCRVLFFLGADESSIPQLTPGQGLLTDRDRLLLEDYGLQLSPRMEEKIGREFTIVYAACAQPQDRLYVTWPAGGETGGTYKPSVLIERLQTMFSETIYQIRPSKDRLYALAATLPEVREALAKEDESLALSFERLNRVDNWKRGRLSDKSVNRLYGKQVAMSASRMDQYKSCHFAYFLRYGLGAKDRRPAGFHAPEYGTFLHFVLETVLRAVKSKGGIECCNDDVITDLTRTAVETYIHRELGGMEQQTPRFRYLFRRLEKSVLSVVENVVAELRTSHFQPIFFELGFGYGKDLPPVEIQANGVTLRISGFVDRVDGWVKDEKIYLKVVDYKTGRKSFDLTEIWNGLSLQMLLYLFALEEKGAELFGMQPIPAGLLYLPAREAAVAGTRGMEEAERQRLLDKELVRRGLVLDDTEVLEAMENTEGGLRFLPLRVSAKTGKITGDALVSAQKLGRLRKHTEDILRQICQEFSTGNIDADPFWRGPTKNACQYCPFFKACQFEEGQDRKRWIPSVKNQDFWAWLARSENGGAGDGSETNT